MKGSSYWALIVLSIGSFFMGLCTRDPGWVSGVVGCIIALINLNRARQGENLLSIERLLSDGYKIGEKATNRSSDNNYGFIDKSEWISVRDACRQIVALNKELDSGYQSILCPRITLYANKWINLLNEKIEPTVYYGLDAKYTNTGRDYSQSNCLDEVDKKKCLREYQSALDPEVLKEIYEFFDSYATRPLKWQEDLKRCLCDPKVRKHALYETIKQPWDLLSIDDWELNVENYPGGVSCFASMSTKWIAYACKYYALEKQIEADEKASSS